MLKLVFCLRRLPSLSSDEFQRYWYERHAPLVRTHAVALGIRRYVQLHSLEDPINAALRAGRGGPEAFDGVAELWWGSRGEMETRLATPEGDRAGRELLEDERRFINLQASPIWIAEERSIIE